MEVSNHKQSKAPSNESTRGCKVFIISLHLAFEAAVMIEIDLLVTINKNTAVNMISKLTFA